MNKLISIEGLYKSYQQQMVLHDFRWDVEQGSIVGLLGRNGSGKSTLFECMLGLRDAPLGNIQLFGEHPQKLSQQNKARIGYVPQNSNLFSWLTGKQLLDYFRHLYPRWNQTKIDRLLQQWDINPSRRISDMSPGQKQKLSIIRALAHEPDLLILDEPAASLDPVGRRDFLKELIENVADQGTTIIFSTHILSDLERIATEVALLKNGQIFYQEVLDEMKENLMQITIPETELAHLKPEKILHRSVMNSGEQKILAQFNRHDLQYLAQNKIPMQHLNLEDLFIAIME